MSLQSFSINSLFEVKGKVVIVTGGGTGIGRAIATALTINGAKVFIIGRRFNVVEETAKELNAAAQEAQSGGECIPIEGDVGTKAGVVEVYEKVSKLTDKLDCLVNNAGFSANWRVYSDDLNDPTKLEKMLWSIEDVDFANMTAIHVSGPYLLAVKFIPLFQKSDDACVTNITSLASHFLNRACCEFAYAQSKAAETHLTKLMAAGLTPFNIRVNSIAPGIFKSQLTTGTTDRDAPLWSIQQNQLKNIPKGREGHWEEIAGAALMLLSPAGAYTNAANIIIDGGWRLFTSANDVQ
ncbi:hypothetical protein L486_01873 [Kwoniella mangroviensis CBS 10435]|uniref:Short-chain dehydrogenase n=1 Tax=Kwoniella mangroviensis CBS 10435 TaxID=1331196 RepID=A0A1B9J343_9TREE|nr:hypothetical protein L486_01873 [Kwoniella mangroviensis CBS 10435]